jgi:hypothetical protein
MDGTGHRRRPDVAATVAAIAAVIAATASLMALVTANRANDIAALNGQPQPHVNVAAEVTPESASVLGPLCFDSSIPPVWRQDFLMFVDVSNSGPIGVDLIGVTQEFQTFTGPIVDGQSTQISTEVAGSLADSVDPIKAWLEKGWHGQWGSYDLDRVEFTGLPVHVDPGTNHRVAVQGTTTWWLPPDISADQMEDVNYPRTPRLIFSFSNGATVASDAGAPTPGSYRDSRVWPSPGASVPTCSSPPYSAWPPN